jgi:hypothetical protein
MLSVCNRPGSSLAALVLSLALFTQSRRSGILRSPHAGCCISCPSPLRVDCLRALGRDAGFYMLWWWIKMRKCEYSGRAGELIA